MAGNLSTEQVLLLNNLMYMPGKSPFQDITGYEGMQVKEIINSFPLNQIKDDEEYGTGTTGREWKEMIRAIQKDEQLMNVTVQTTHTDHADGGGGGVSALFTDPQTNEAVVVFRGTAGREWKDNFQGGAATNTSDGVSTPQQQNALEWYENLNLDQYDSVTVSGHSKGGNKAKYITLMNSANSVDRCLSFDGQGFSDEFYDRYSNRIGERQHLIENHNVEGDYVNILLNDVGETTYYKAHNIGEMGIAENHCPNTFFAVGEDGTLYMVPGEQNGTMEMADDFLNSYLRTLPEGDKQATLNFIGEIAQMCLGDEKVDMQNLLDVFLEGDNIKHTARLLAYLRVYDQKYPEFADSIKKLLNENGLQDISNYVDTVDAILDWKYSDWIFDGADWLSDKIPDFLLDLLIKFLKENTGLEISREELKKILSILRVMNQEMDQISEIPIGSDKIVSSTIEADASFMIIAQGIRRACENMKDCSGKLKGASEDISRVMSMKHASYMELLDPAFRACRNMIADDEKHCDILRQTLESILELYCSAEQQIVRARK